METNFHEYLKSQLEFITNDEILIVKCNDINERSAVNNLANRKGYCTINIHSNQWRENFIMNKLHISDSEYFSKIHWINNEMKEHNYSDYCYEEQYYNNDDDYYYDHDYYRYSNRYSYGKYIGNFIPYHYDKQKRLECYINNEIIIDLDYNAVAIYPSYMISKYIKLEIFNNRKNKICKHYLEKNISNITKIEERKIINNIWEKDLYFRSKNKVLNSYDTRNIILIKELIKIYLNNFDILPLLYWYYSNY